MIRKIIVGITLLLISNSYAQNGSNSPYSFFGLGELRFRGTVENQSMGGISVFADSIAFNFRNPAAFGNLRLTTYTVAASYTNLSLKNETTTESTGNGAFEYLALAFPLSPKLGIGFGVIPYSSVGYQLESLDETQDPNVLDRFSGDGGLNRAFLSVGYAITKNFSIGATANYDFGRIDNDTRRIIEGVQLATREVNESSLSGIDVNLALNYKGRLTKDLMLHSSVIYAPEATITSENERRLETISTITGVDVVAQSINVDLDALNLRETDLIIPSTTTFGLGVGKLNKWFVGGEYEIKKIGNFENSFLSISNLAYEDGSRFSLGGFYVPRYNSFSSYWSRVTYRLGLRYEETGIRLNNTPVNDFGISFGLGLPVGGSKLNIGFEGGRRGTTTAGRVEETYFSVKVSLSLLGKWFRKVQYN
ncbi:hypothetical protein GWK08_15075 [Leptobacterium flavescens]|uniref:Outer membrane beta-barrel protein n=1 Tax=Leptobacterium flavescens TaxID=472055 RepID=A0A6P0UP60_9FLAO|nr:hypothetical protein [Leptobacterium flavescens]NER14777.1 hypothetical protein [Leptobacterium flavescens]